MKKPAGWFTRFANNAAHATGHTSAFVIAASVVAIWAITGPLFKFSDTWQLVINTGTTIITFLMVFLIQNTQNRDSAAIHLKLDELIRSHKQAHNSMLDLEHGDEEILDKLRERYDALATKARNEGDATIADDDRDGADTAEKPRVRAGERSR
jgi:low affinity Fe/Cu permease